MDSERGDMTGNRSHRVHCIYYRRNENATSTVAGIPVWYEEELAQRTQANVPRVGECVTFAGPKGEFNWRVEGVQWVLAEDPNPAADIQCLIVVQEMSPKQT